MKRLSILMLLMVLSTAIKAEMNHVENMFYQMDILSNLDEITEKCVSEKSFQYREEKIDNCEATGSGDNIAGGCLHILRHSVPPKKDFDENVSNCKNNKKP